MCELDEKETARQILVYLLEHQAAQDSQEGIAGWWMLEQTIKQRLAHLNLTLSGLVAGKLLLTHTTRDGRVHYKLNRRRLKRIKALLEQG